MELGNINCMVLKIINCLNIYLINDLGLRNKSIRITDKIFWNWNINLLDDIDIKLIYLGIWLA